MLLSYDHSADFFDNLNRAQGKYRTASSGQFAKTIVLGKFEMTEVKKLAAETSVTKTIHSSAAPTIFGCDLVDSPNESHFELLP